MEEGEFLRDIPHYASPAGGSYYWMRQRDALVFISMGEFQPGRCMVYFEGVFPATTDVLDALSRIKG